MPLPSTPIVRFTPIALLAASLFLAPCAARAQQAPAAPSLPPIDAPANSGNRLGANTAFSDAPAADPAREHMMHGLMRQRATLRQKQIVDDSQQLVKLTQQLMDAVDKSNKDELSLDVVNYATEIEKLAKSVKDKMRDGQ